MIVVHGGAGAVAPERHARLRQGVRAAAHAGNAMLERGGTALDAVVAAVRILEDDPEFGAGIGSALTRDGTVETCATVMDGARRRAGAVAAVPDIGAPVIVARAMLETAEHVLLAGTAAQKYAIEIGFQPAAPNALVTPHSMARLCPMNDTRPKFRFAAQRFVDLLVDAAPRQIPVATEMCAEACAEIHGTARHDQYSKNRQPVRNAFGRHGDAARNRDCQICTKRSVSASGRVVAAPTHVGRDSSLGLSVRWVSRAGNSWRRGWGTRRSDLLVIRR